MGQRGTGTKFFILLWKNLIIKVERQHLFVYLCHPEHRVLMFSRTEAALADVDTRGDFQSYFLSFHANL